MPNPATDRITAETISPAAVIRLYDRMARYYDWFSFYEARAKLQALQLLDLAPDQRVLNVGLGTGKEHEQIQAAIRPNGMACGLDLSPHMLTLAHRRTSAPLCRADGGHLPYASESFDRLLSSYVLDLVPFACIPEWLSGFRRVLRQGGRMVLLSLTEGVNPPSRVFVRLWSLAYSRNPLACGGCRPLQLSQSAERAGFEIIERRVIVQYSVPSEVIVAK